MQRLARSIARRLWWGSLWLMRRRWMRGIQSASIRWMSTERAEKARRSLVRQNAFARKIGLRLLTAVVMVVLVSVTIQLVFSLALYLVDSGVLRPRRFANEE